jgi:hypothetical protein
LTALVGRLLAKEPEQRVGDADTLARELAPLAVDHDLAALLRNDLPPPSPLLAEADTQTPRNEKTTPDATGRLRLRPQHLIWVAAAVALVAVGGFLARLGGPGGQRDEIPQPGGKVDEIPPQGLLASSEMERGRWYYPLRERPPSLLEWNHINGSDFLNSPRQDQLTVVRWDGPALLAAGSIQARKYRIEVGMRETSWKKPVGIFYGYSEQRDATGPTTYSYQRLTVSAKVGMAAQEPQHILDLHLVRGEGKTESADPVANQEVDVRLTEENTLAIQIRDGQLQTIEWNGKVLPAVLAPRGVLPGPNDAHGLCGVYLVDGSAKFSHFGIMIQER